jgi:lipopolysaccharide export system permease protein
MKTLSRYLLKEHLAPFLFALAALTGMMIVNQVARQFASLIGKGLPWSIVGEVFALSLPFIFAMTLPMAVLVAVLYAFARLGADNEITALKASGIDLVRLVRPVVLAAAVLSVFTFAFVDQVLPRSNHSLKTLMVDIARKKPTFELREQMVNEVVPGQLFLRAGRIDQAADRMRDVVLYDLANDTRRRTIYADSGYMRLSADGTNLYLTLFDGYAHDYDRGQSQIFRRVFFRTDLVRVRGVSNRLERTESDAFKGDREMSVCEMEAVVAGDLRSLSGLASERAALLENDVRALVGVAARPPADSGAPPRRRTLTTLYCAALQRLAAWIGPTPAQAAQQPRVRLRTFPLSDPAAAPRVTGSAPAAPGATRVRAAADPHGQRLAGQLEVLRSRWRNARQHAASFQVEIHKKLSIAVSCLVFVLIGAPVALRFPRGGVGLVIGASVVIFGVYYVGLIGGETLADQLVIAPFWAMWTPNVLMTLIGLLLFRRLGREHATTRAAGVAEAIRDRLDRWRARRGHR